MFLRVLVVFWLFVNASSGEVDGLVEWLREYGSFLNSDRIEVRESLLGGNGIFLKGGDISPLDDPILLEIPYHLSFHPFSPHLSPDVREMILFLDESIRDCPTDLYENLFYLALTLEMRNTSSFFSPYFKTLSRVTLPVFGIRLGEGDISLVEELENVYGSGERIRRMQQKYRYYLREYSSRGLVVGEEEYFYVASLASSRSFGQTQWLLGAPLKYQGLLLPAMIPYFDCVNHLPHQDVVHNRYSYHVTPEETYAIRWRASMIGVTPIKDGSELFTAYHDSFSPPDEFLFFYGFLVKPDFSERKNLYHYIGFDGGNREELEKYLARVDYAIPIVKNQLLQSYFSELSRVLQYLIEEEKSEL